MKRPLKSIRPIGPFNQFDSGEQSLIGLLFLAESDNGELLDINRAQGVISPQLMRQLEDDLQHPIESVNVWRKQETEKAIGHEKEGMSVVVEQRDAFFGKPSMTSSNQVERARNTLISMKGIGPLEERYFIQCDPQ